jgi:hypothetical protein
MYALDYVARNRKSRGRWRCVLRDGVGAEVRCQPDVDIHRTSRMKSGPKHIAQSRRKHGSAKTLAELNRLLHHEFTMNLWEESAMVEGPVSPLFRST